MYGRIVWYVDLVRVQTRRDIQVASPPELIHVVTQKCRCEQRHIQKRAGTGTRVASTSNGYVTGACVSLKFGLVLSSCSFHNQVEANQM